MNKTHDFLTASNIEILWEVISEQNIHYNKGAFKSALTEFYERENTKHVDLVLLNKAFISSVFSAYSQQQQQQQSLRQKIPITFEELQNEKLSHFEIKLTEKEDDFKQSMTRHMPQQIPNFRDKMDEPLTEIELIMKRTIAERNYDIAQIVSTNPNPNVNTNQLKPQETSIKKEKLSPLFFASLREPQNKPEIKYIKIDNASPVPIDLDNPEKSEKPEKHISWDHDIQKEFFYNSVGVVFEEKETQSSTRQVKSPPNRIEQMKKVHDETLEVFRKKNADYGDSFATYGIIGILIRIEDKLRRAISISKSGVSLVADEGIRDTLLDLHNYAAMGLMLMDEE